MTPATPERLRERRRATERSMNYLRCRQLNKPSDEKPPVDDRKYQLLNVMFGKP